MKPTSEDGQNESTGEQWPRKLKIKLDEFQQSYPVAQLAVKLCDLQKRELQNKWEVEDKKYAHDIQTAVTESEKKRVNDERNKQMGSRIATLAPEGFLVTAWQLIEKASEHVLRAQTDAEYLRQHDGSHEAGEKVVERKLQGSRIPFKKLCNRERREGDSEPIKLFDAESGRNIEVDWKVYTTQKAFDNLFWAYWDDIGEVWKKEFSSNPKRYDIRRIETELADIRRQIGEQERAWQNVDAGARKQIGKQLADVRATERDLEQRKSLVKLVSDASDWKERGKQKLDEWKREGVPPNDFLALARFRRQRDKRAANLKTKPKRKRWRQLKAR